MENTIVWRQIQKFNQSLRWHNLLGVALLLGLGCLQYRYLRNCFLGPDKIDANRLMQIKDLGSIDRDFVTFTSPKALDTGFNKVSVSKRSQTETVTKKYALAIVGTEKALLIEAKPEHDLQNPTFTGGLSEIDAETQSQVVDRLLKDAPPLQGRLLPFMLESGDYQTWSYFLLPLLVGGLGICGWNLYRSKIRTENPRKHPVYNALSKYGDADLLATDIDREIRTNYNIDQLKPNTFYLTPSWLVFPQTYDLQITKLDQLMWVYKKVTSHSVNFIPTGKSYELALHDRLGRERTIKLSEGEVNDTIVKIAGHAPWAVVGFDPEIKTMWDKKRDEFYAMVEQRKRSQQ